MNQRKEKHADHLPALNSTLARELAIRHPGLDPGSHDLQLRHARSVIVSLSARNKAIIILATRVMR